MMCDECGIRPAQFHLTTITGEEKTERNLCAVCMAKYQKQIPGLDFSNLAGLISGFLESAAGKQSGADAQEDAAADGLSQLRDDLCDLSKDGHARRARATQAFRKPLEGLLMRRARHTQHCRAHSRGRQKRRLHPHEHRPAAPGSGQGDRRRGV